MNKRIPLIPLSGLALLLLSGCSETRRNGTAGYDPCRQMKEEAKTVDTLERQIKDLRAQAYPEEGEPVVLDSAAKVRVESLLIQKQNLLTLSIQAMQKSAQDCDAQSQPFDRYRTAPEREERL